MMLLGAHKCFNTKKITSMITYVFCSHSYISINWPVKSLELPENITQVASTCYFV